MDLSPFRRAGGQPEKTWLEVIRKDLETKRLNEDLLKERGMWRRLIRKHDPT